MKNLVLIFEKKETGREGGRKKKAGETKGRKRSKDELKVNVFSIPFQTWSIEDLTLVHTSDTFPSSSLHYPEEEIDLVGERLVLMGQDCCARDQFP